MLRAGLAALCPVPPFALPFVFSTTGSLVGRAVAFTTPGSLLTAATSRLLSGAAEVTVFGTGLLTVGFAETTTRGRATASDPVTG